MRRMRIAVFIMGVSLGMAQPAGPNAPTNRAGAAPRIAGATARGGEAGATNSSKVPELPPNSPVVTLLGLCSDPKAKSDCKTVITREELDRFVDAFSPAASGPIRGRLAVQYAKLLAFSVLAEQQGFDRDPALAKEIDAQLKLIRMRILASAFSQILQRDAPASTDAEVQQYYDAHRDMYQQAHILRIAVPLEVANETGKPLDRAKVTAAMQEFQRRAAAGGDFGQLQQELYRQLHIQATPPPVNVTVQRGNAQGDEAKVFGLKAGEVSSVLDLPGSVAIIKMESKGWVPLSDARAEIQAFLRGASALSALGQLTNQIKTQFNLEYLDLPSEPDIFGTGASKPIASAASSPASPAKP